MKLSLFIATYMIHSWPRYAQGLSTRSRFITSSALYNAVLTSSSVASSSSALLGDIKPRVVFVLGGPGAGKGTQCEKLAKDFGMRHLSAGELLRQERLSGSADGELIESYIKNGQIVPVKITMGLLKKALEESSCSRFLVDGFPRNADNLQGWESSMTGVCDVETMILIEVCEEELERRLLSRGKTSGRSDDNIEAAKKRFHTYKEITLPVVSHFENMNKLVRIRGEGTIDDVYSEIISAINPLFEEELLKLSSVLLNAVATRNWPVYSYLCDKDITYVGPDTHYNIISGIDHHEHLFSSTSSDSRVALLYGNPSSITNVCTPSINYLTNHCTRSLIILFE
jgi:UMP-CMP kinase